MLRKLLVIAAAVAIPVGMIAISESAAGAAGAKAPTAPTAANAANAANAKKTSGIARYKNRLAANTKGWCNASPPNAPCDGGVNNYGTIDIVKSSFTNSGGYAPSVPSPGTQKKYARVSGGQSTGIGEGVNGCSVPGSENCSGPYALFGGGNYKIFPSSGFTTSVQLYLDTAWANRNPGQVIDWDVALNNSSGGFGEDNAFNLCSTSAGGGGFNISTSFGAGGCSTGPSEITASGWYTFNLTFTVVAGTVQDTYSVLNSANAMVFSSAVNTGNLATAMGGPLYMWLPDEDAQGLPMAQVSLMLLSH